MRAVWRRVDAHLHSAPRGVPQIYGAIIAMLLVLLLNRIDPRDFGITWSTFLGFIGLNAVFAIANVFYRRSRS